MSQIVERPPLLAGPRETPSWGFKPEEHFHTNPSENHAVGMIDFGARMAIRDLIRVHGFEDARELVAMYLLDEGKR